VHCVVLKVSVLFAGIVSAVHQFDEIALWYSLLNICCHEYIWTIENKMIDLICLCCLKLPKISNYLHIPLCSYIISTTFRYFLAHLHIMTVSWIVGWNSRASSRLMIQPCQCVRRLLSFPSPSPVWLEWLRSFPIRRHGLNWSWEPLHVDHWDTSLKGLAMWSFLPPCLLPCSASIAFTFKLQLALLTVDNFT